ncbi:hypothetical protein [Rubrivivax gelatinosus]|uniref:hypothetical protein n=1 Tax=Rubrivivax gelatinosus TaxID=28068 RepID=UPI00030737DB|nr:hypothetical protein [Rubrivivax gelatinosus]MBG6078596.1 hypothetical protein [Rubrivivax gelatinosus]
MALVDLVIAVTLLEALVLWIWHARTGRGLAPRDFVANLCAGLALMLAVRAALAGAAWTWVAAGLAAAGVAHLLDLRRRWRR